MDDIKYESLARDGIQKFNDDDFDGIGALLADDFVYEETGSGRRLEGVPAFLEVLREWKTAIPDLRGEVTRLVATGSTVALEVRWRGTHDGPLPTPAGVVPPSGAPVEMWSTFWNEYRGELQVSERNHVDVLTLLGQVGALG